MAEVIGTTALKASDSFTRWLPWALAVAACSITFYFLSITLRSMPTGMAYAIGSGLGIVPVTLTSFALYQQRIDLAGLPGMAPIIAGVVVLNVFSKSAAHWAAFTPLKRQAWNADCLPF